MRRLVVLASLAACGSDAELPDAPLDAGYTCGCTYGNARQMGAVTPDGADELSGLAASLTVPGRIWSHNDGSGKPRLFALSTYGAGIGIALLPAATVTDWEDIASGPCVSGSCLYVADTGDNDRLRTSVQIYEVDEPGEFRGMVEANYRAYSMTYPDGAHDVEALFVDPRDQATYVITKEATKPAQVFRMPRVDGQVTVAVPVATFIAPEDERRVTGADLHVDECGVRLLVRTYNSLWELRAPVGTAIPALFASPPVAVPVAVEPQGEAVAYLPSGHEYVTVTDGTDPRISRASCE